MEIYLEKNQPTSIIEAAQKLPELFSLARKIYDQESGTMYSSNNTIHGLHMSVLPYRNTYEFTTYSAGDTEDVKLLRSLVKSDEKIFKTYDCSLCALQEDDNTIIVSQEQNQLLVDKQSPAVRINHLFEGEKYNNISPIKYLITGTVPQYYYNHLLLSSLNHLPTYAVFLDFRVLYDLMIFLELTSKMEPNIYAYFNGNFGSDIFHFHTHLTNQRNEILEHIVKNYKENGTFLYSGDIVRMSVFVENDIQKLTESIYNTDILNVILSNSDLRCTANFFVKNGRYYVTIQLIHNQAPFKYKNCSFILFPASFVLAAVNCFIPPADINEYQLFSNQIKEYYKNTYQDPNLYLKKYDYNQTIQTIISYSITDILSTEYIEQLYVWMEDRRLLERIDTDILENIIEFLYNHNCYNPDYFCTHSDIGRFKYLIGILFNYAPDESIFKQEKVKEIMILSEYQRMKNMNKSKNITTDYMYFKGSFIQDFIYRTINNLLLITQDMQSSTVSNQTSMITKWLTTTFKRIGELSAYGVNTIAEINLPDLPIDMVMKTMCKSDTVQQQFIHEFFAGIQINELRVLVPHFIITYGGFLCDSSSKTCNNSNINGLCDKGPGNNITYLLIENVKNSQTLSRHIKTPILSYENEANDIADCVMQIFIALMFGWENNNFTHYDLHINNVMIYDFVRNKNFLQLFREYKENINEIPQIKYIFFRYFTKEMTQIIIPAKYLMLIIDYGNTYVNDMPSNAYFSMPYLVNIGMTPDRPNEIVDIYTFLLSFFTDIFISKPYLIINKQQQTWYNNILYKLLLKTIHSYGELWLREKPPDIIMNELLQIILTKQENLNHFFYTRIKEEYRIKYYMYLVPSFPVESIPQDFRGSKKVVEWMLNNHYKQMNLEEKLNQENVYVFDWGHLPPDHMEGIQPTKEIKNNMQERINQKRRMSMMMREFIP